MIDVHMHCRHSGDSIADPREMLLAAIDKGVEYCAFTDHCNLDFELIDKYCMPSIDLENHFAELAILRDEFAGKIEVAIGLECGWAKYAEQEYLAIEKQYPCDIIVNSTHMVCEQDIYKKDYFISRDKKNAYGDYLRTIRESLDCPYQFDTIGHMGYVTRKATYEDPQLRYKDFADEVDDILRTLIVKGKSLEINAHSRDENEKFLPSKEIFARYKELGGELVTFGSDAHSAKDIVSKYDFATELLKSLGFKYLFKYFGHKPTAVKI